MSERAGFWNRREFLATLAAISVGTLAKPVRGLGLTAPEKIKLGFDNFSVRAFDWKAPQLIDYASSLNVDTLLMSDLDVYESLEEDYLKQIRDQAARAGIEIQAGTGSICPTSKSYNEKKWGKAEDHARLLVRTAKHLGTPVARCYLGSRRDRDGEGIDRHIEEILKVLKAVQSEAEDANVKIAIENHAGDMQAWELVGLIESAGKHFVGATMDPGNAAWTLEDPLVNLEILGPYVVTTGIRDTALWETEHGATAMWANMGQGVVDWQVYVERFRELCPAGTPFVLEIISYKWANEAQYLKPEFWSKFPRARAHEFARFVALAKQGKMFETPPGRPSGDGSVELEQAQQKFDLEESLKYCRQVLGLGVRE